MKRQDTLLVSMPWADYQFPSLQISSLAAYVRQFGYQVDTCHLHLDTAATLGFGSYDTVLQQTRDFLDAELIFGALLFPERSEKVVAYLDASISGMSQRLKKIQRVMMQLYKGIPWKKYGLVGFTISYEQLFASLLFARWLKQDHPLIRVVFGGPGVAGQCGKSLLKCFPEVDWCIDGEGEQALTKLINHIASPETVPSEEVPGLVYRKGVDVKINPRQQLSNLRGLKIPDFENYLQRYQEYEVYKKTGLLPILPIETSRGCPHRCAFCSVRSSWNGYRTRPAEEVAAQLEQLSDRYRINAFYFVDNLLLPKQGQYLMQLLKRQGRDYRLFCEIRADASKELLRSMKRVGLGHVKIGIESFSTRLLQKMHKATRAIDNLQILKICESLRIAHVSNLILGFPTETQRDIDEAVDTMEFALAYKPPACIVPFAMKAGSPTSMQPGAFHARNIRCGKVFRRMLPARLARVFVSTFQDFTRKRKMAPHAQFRKTWERWKKRYEDAHAEGRQLLNSYDCKSFLRIVDQRFGEREVILEGEVRKLYLYCDSIRHFDEIRRHMSGWNLRQLRQTLKQLVQMKLMFREDEAYLSLAISAKDDDCGVQV